MTEEQHTPSPQEPRGIYGFILMLLMNSCTVGYFMWMLIPREWFESLPYEPPQTYWGFTVPVFVCTTLFLFAFCIYPSMHSLHDGDLDEECSFTDPYSLPENYFEILRAEAKAKKVHKSSFESKINHSLKFRDNEKDKCRTWSSKYHASKNSTEKYSNDEYDSVMGIGTASTQPISPVADMDLDNVCQQLYLNLT